MKPTMDQDVAASQAPRRITIDTPCKKDLLSQRTEEHVQQVFEIFLPLDGSGSFFPNARCWSQTKATFQVNPHMFFFQLLLLLCETKSEGSAMPEDRYEANPSNYKDAAKLVAAMLKHTITSQQKEMAKKMVKQDYVFDLRFLHLVNQEMKQKGKGKKKGQAPPAPPAAQGAAVAENLSDLDLDAVQVQFETFHVNDEHHELLLDDILDDEFEKRMRAREQKQIEELVAAAANVAAAAAQQQQQQPVEEEDAAETFLDNYKGPVQMPKIRFCVVPVPGANGLVVGMLCRFIVFDPAIHPGKFFDNVLDNLRRRLQGKQKAQRTVHSDLFPEYGLYHGSKHPAGNKVSKQTYFLAASELLQMQAPAAPAFEESLSDRLSFMDYLSESSDFHLKNLLSTERACEAMRQCGVPAEYCIPGVWYDKLAKKCMFPLIAYKYASPQVFWYSRTHVGLSEQFFPHIDLSTDFLSNLLAGNDIEQFLSEEVRNVSLLPRLAAGEKGKCSTVFERRRHLIETQPVISRDELLANNLVPYETNNEYIHKAAETKAINKRANQECPAHYLDTLAAVDQLRRGDREWRNTLYMTDPELAERVRECDRYNEIRQQAQSACAQVFDSLWLLDGDVDALSVPETIKIIQKWYIDNKAAYFPNMTRDFRMWDPEMSMFGNSMLRRIKIYSCIAMILQPLICLLAHGLFAVYHYQPKTILFNMMLPGRFDVGKTFAGVTTLMNYTAIEGTVVEYTQATRAADTTKRHNYDKIIASDEVAPWKVSMKDALKNEDLVNKEKVKMTNLQIGLEAYVTAVGPNGENVRWTENILTDHHVTRIECTNAIVEAMNPLASRYFRMTVAQPRIPARLMTTVAGDAINHDNTLHLRINQYLTAWYCKAEMCGAVLPDVELTLFDDIANRVINYLAASRVVDKSFGKRGLDILKPYVRQLVYAHAFHCAFDMPNGPCYKKPFSNALLKYVQPYMYVTTDMICWSFTAMAGILFDENISNVVNALRKAAGIDERNQFSNTYEMFEHDTKNGGEGQIRWKTTENLNVGKKSDDGYVKGDEYLIDLTYVRYEGRDFMSMCGAIASFTRPCLSASDVAGVLNILKAMQVPLKNAFIPQPAGTFKKWHKYLETPVPSTGFPGRKEVDNVGGIMPMEYRQRNPLSTEPRTLEDVPMYDHERSCTAIEIHSDRIYFMPDIDQCFQSQKIVEALEYAFLCQTTRPGKILLGFPEDHDATQMQIYNLSEKLINKHIANYDRADGWAIHPRTGQNTWIGDQNMPEDQRPISRREGICFDRRGGLTRTDSVFFNTVPAAPILDDEDSMSKWQSKINEDIVRMNKPNSICKDLDLESAKRRHMLCGRSLDEPILSPAYIEQTYKAKCNELKIPWHLDMDYPHDHLLEKDELETQWEIHGGIANQIAVGQQHYREARMEHNVPRKPELRQKIAAQKEKHKGTRRERVSNLHLSGTHVPLDDDATNAGFVSSFDMQDLRAVPGGAGKRARIVVSADEA